MFYKSFSDVVICPSEVGKEDLKKYYSVSKGRVVVNAISDRFDTEKELPENTITISYLGRFDPTKGVMDLVSAFQNYVDQIPETRLRLRMAGSGVQKEAIEQKCAYVSKIQFVGYLPYPEVDAYLRESHYAIIPSKFDNLPTVGIEALMNKTPLLISNTTGLTRYLTEGKDCYKFDPNVPEMMRIFSTVEANKDGYSEMSSKARETYLNTFSIANYCHAMTNLIE